MIELEKPYSDDWKHGFLIEENGRKKIVLYNSDSDRSTTAYARYLYAVSIGRYLEKEEYIDHIDNDRTNDSLDNLQILSNADNVRKANADKFSRRVPNHGSLTEYRYCKCELCKKAKSDYMREYKKNRIG